EWVGRAVPFIDISYEVVYGAMLTASIGVPAAFAVARSSSSVSENWRTVAAMLVYPAIVYTIVVKKDRFIELGAGWFYVCNLVTFVPILLAGWVWALITLRGYVMGFVVFVSFVAAMQVLYFLNTPWFADQINAQVTSVLGRPP